MLGKSEDTERAIAETFQFYFPPDEYIETRSEKLYLVPTTHGESYDPDFSPMPSPLSELPDPERWTKAFVLRIIEILGGRRPMLQIARNTHRHTFNDISSKVGVFRELPRIKRIHRSAPIEGVLEITVLLSFPKRVRAMVLRLEGVDGRWLCTEFELL